MKYRRFGKTDFQIPVISSGGMRFQHSWKGSDEVPPESQERLEKCVRHALDLGINHFETARGYGTSEAQLGKILSDLPRSEIILQTKVGPAPQVDKFVAAFEKSMSSLGVDYLDLFAFHGVNNQEALDNALRCMDVVRGWKQAGRIRAIGFSTHAATETILDALKTELFDYVNIHWYYIFQDNWPAIEEARRQDMGVFIISPNDKAGLLYKPSDKLVSLTEPLHPMVFNGLFCLMHEEVHTLSCGISRAEDFDIHMETVEKLDDAEKWVAPVIEKLEAELARVLGNEWAETWEQGLPDWNDTPGEINMRWILRLRNLALAYDMVEYGKMRYNMLGNGGHWFPGAKADAIDEIDLSECLANSPHAATIPTALAEAHTLLAGEEKKRLIEDEA
ncbi:MAG: aldo/keto reductase [Candidatus Hydrogenedentes bacterium]|nr:aldo/keto reductase [Candidatus Hydrogenedentota bacterium]